MCPDFTWYCSSMVTKTASSTLLWMLKGFIPVCGLKNKSKRGVSGEGVDLCVEWVLEEH